MIANGNQGSLLIPVSRIYFSGKAGFKLSVVQSAILLGLGLQYKTVDVLQVCACPCSDCHNGYGDCMYGL